MVKRKKHAGSRSTFDNPLAAARSGKSSTTIKPALTKVEENKRTTRTTSKNNNNDTTKAGTIDWVEFGTAGRNTPNRKRNDKLASKTSKKAEQIWHRRSGAGFHLFLDYYLGQPDGIVGVSVSDGGEPSLASLGRQALAQAHPTQIGSTPRTGGAGQSRAALRRKKKKRRTTTGNDDSASNQGIETTASIKHSPPSPIPVTNSYRHDQLLYGGRLLEIFSSKTSKSASKSTPAAEAATTTKSLSPASYREFFTALSRPLPLTFRFRRYETSGNPHEGIVPSYQQRRQRMQKIKGLRQILKGQTLAKANTKPVPFDEHIYQAKAPPEIESSSYPFPVDKASLKRTCPQLKEFLNNHTGDGTIARQELGSMLPVWLLDRIGAFSGININERPLRVLDTCASPGSKTLQVAELVSATKGGRVRANDVNANRLESLQEALARSGFFRQRDGDGDESDSDGAAAATAAASMNSLVRFSNVDASRYPIPKSETKKYPIILCDVPCSGDGTVRKDIHVIPNWTPNISNALHSLQVNILTRAMRCVALNGIVSYSTCSLNPIEDEAVVRAALEIEQTEGKFGFELVQVSKAQLNGLVLRSGVFSWRVADFDPTKATSNSYGNANANENSNENSKHGDSDGKSRNNSSENDSDGEEQPAQLQWYDSYQNALDGGMENALASMWPPPAVVADELLSSSSSSISKSIPLDRCLRLLPQDQDTGGFFVALIRRIK